MIDIMPDGRRYRGDACAVVAPMCGDLDAAAMDAWEREGKGCYA